MAKKPIAEVEQEQMEKDVDSENKILAKNEADLEQINEEKASASPESVEYWCRYKSGGFFLSTGETMEVLRNNVIVRIPEKVKIQFKANKYITDNPKEIRVLDELIAKNARLNRPKVLMRVGDYVSMKQAEPIYVEVLINGQMKRVLLDELKEMYLKTEESVKQFKSEERSQA